MESTRIEGTCRDPGCGCGPTSRRDFIKVVGLAASVAAGGRMPVMAGPFEEDNEYLQTIPRDKKLAKEWVASLTARGVKAVETDPKALAHIGMPVGGLFAGTVYLGGDGRLWLWDIFNRDQEGIQPRMVSYQGEPLRTPRRGELRRAGRTTESLRAGLRDPRRLGLASARPHGLRPDRVRRPIPDRRVRYAAVGSPVRVELEAFSPFIPLEVDDSSLPAILMSYTITNESNADVEGELRGWLANPVGLETAAQGGGRRHNQVVRDPSLTLLIASAMPHAEAAVARRPDIVFADFESGRYEGWTAEGTAFGDRPVEIARIPAYQGDVGGQGLRVVNSHASAPGGSIQEKDSRTGTLTSPPFPVDRRYITFLIGGGSHRGQTSLELLFEGEVVASATGRDSNRMQLAGWDVARFQGNMVRLRIADRATGPWGNIGVDRIVFTDTPPASWRPLAERPDFGTMALALLGGGDVAGRATAHLIEPTDDWPAENTIDSVGPLDRRLLGGVGRPYRLKPGESVTAMFIIAWQFPNFHGRGVGGRKVGHRYAVRFGSAAEVARHVAAHFERLAGSTRRWVDTWYDSTLPWWFLDRTMANTSTLATTTCYRFADGRFWAWEGVGCCEGTCTHVWQYAQAPDDCSRRSSGSPASGSTSGWRCTPTAASACARRSKAQRAGRRRPVRADPRRLPRAPDVGRRRLPPPRLAARQGGDRAPDRARRQRRRPARGGPGEHAGCRLVRQDLVDLVAVPRGARRRRGDGRRDGRSRLRAAGAARSPTAARGR